MQVIPTISRIDNDRMSANQVEREENNGEELEEYHGAGAGDAAAAAGICSTAEKKRDSDHSGRTSILNCSLPPAMRRCDDGRMVLDGHWAAETGLHELSHCMRPVIGWRSAGAALSHHGASRVWVVQSI